MFNDTSTLIRFRGPWGIPIDIGGSIIVLALIFVSFSGGGVELAFSAAFFGLVILSIFLHELGHAWACVIQGIPVRRIMIYGGGGFCEQSQSASAYQTEFIVAMGPIVNLAIWAVASLVSDFIEPGYLWWALNALAQINLFLALLNLLPVQPLDGGKLFQLALMRALPGLLATQIAGGVGLIMALLWIPGMLYVFATYGLLLFFFPPLRLHWQMFRAGR